MSEKSRICFALVYTAVIFSLAWAAPTVRAQGQGCSVITPTKPSIYVVSDGRDRDKKVMKLRIVNNSNCVVTIETTSGPPLTLAVPVEFPVSVHYLVQVDSDQIRDGYDWGDTVVTYDIPGGKSIIFMVPVKQFHASHAIIIPFNYAWEIASKKTDGSGPVQRHVSFRTTETH